MYLKQATLKRKYDMSKSTAIRVCKYMRSQSKYAPYIDVINGDFRYEEQAFKRASNERKYKG